jgi:mxaJ protein
VRPARGQLPTWAKKDGTQVMLMRTTCFLAALTVFAGSAATAARAADSSANDAATSNTLRVCAAKNEPPFSTEDGKGFENRIADALGSAMGRQVQTVWLDKPAIYLVRDALDKHSCDVVMGLDTDDPRVLSSRPYYRSGYVFITRADRNLDITSWNDPRLLKLEHFAVTFDSPGEEMLKQNGKYDENLNYDYSLVNFKSRRNQYVQIEPGKLVSEVASGKADVAVAFGPEVARYVKASAVPLRMTLIKDDAVRSDKAKVPQQFSQSIGVRKDDRQLLSQVDAALAKAQPQIQRILDEEGIPLVAGSATQGHHVASN